MSMQAQNIKNKSIVFNFDDESDKEDEFVNQDIEEENDILSEIESLDHIKKINYIDNLEIKRQSIKRNSKKAGTEFIPSKKIEQFTDDILKLTEEIDQTHFSPQIKNRNNDRKRTIRFDTKKTTYLYPKEKNSKKEETSTDKDTQYDTEDDIKDNDLAIDALNL